MFICVGLLCIIWGGYFLVKKYGADRTLKICDSDLSWVCQVDSTEIQNDKFVLNGFAFKLDVDATKEAYDIVLHDIDMGKNYFPKMEYCIRDDVDDYFQCEYNYEESGFRVSVDVEKVVGKTIEILLKVVGEQRTYRTGTYLFNGKLMHVNPKEYQSLEVQDTDLEEIVDKGILRVYRPDLGMYVYQYEGALYWIVEADYGFVDGDTYVKYELETTQIERLPKYCAENGWTWDNLGFEFSECEMKGMNTGKYRVAKKEIPTEYSIRKIRTAKYIDNWVWVEFLPFYQFNILQMNVR